MIMELPFLQSVLEEDLQNHLFVPDVSYLSHLVLYVLEY